MLAAIVLAAGASRRMGTPKALLTHGGEPFLSGIVKAAYAAGVERRVAVLGYMADKILSVIDLTGVQVVRSTELDAGPIGSVRAGISAVGNHPVDGILVWPVDRPRVHVETVRALVERFEQTGGPIVAPRFQGRRGHPVIFAETLFEELRQAPNDQGARAVVRRDQARVVEVEVDDPGVVEDINTPDDYRKLVREENARSDDIA
ncbi:MAG TPA: nucleotidyltransferase family protein [Gemmatimonadales bacterium]|nr:nucleotidyltransferase family protein [Gemmatimonadales bacterium]